MSYVLAASSSPSFVLGGLKGYEFGPLKDPDFAVHLVKVTKGHDTFIVSKALTRIYYIVEGEGVFTIDNQDYEVSRGRLVEVPPGVEYSYSGSMEILLVSYPRWFEGNEQETRINPVAASNSYAGGLVGYQVKRYLRHTLRLVRNWARRYRLIVLW
jgi:mannose-6-phosphate isomerase-like protein (cupin superfamily)